MKRTISLITICALVMTVPVCRNMAAAAAAEQPFPADGTYIEDEIIVGFENGAKPQQAARKLGAETIKAIEATADTSVISGKSPCVITLPKGESVAHALQKCKKDPNIAYAQPNYVYSYDASEDGSGMPISRASAVTRDDTNRWHLKKIDTQEAWDLIDEIEAERKAAGKEDLKKVTVAVLDTGVNLQHEDLQAALNPQKCVQVEGYLAPTNPNEVYPQLTGDDGGHGTKVAGIIGATSGNHKGSAGVAAGNRNQIVELSVIDVYERYNHEHDRLARSSDLIKAIDYAVGSKINAKVINMSLGHPPKSEGSKQDPALAAKIREVVQEKQVTVVCSAGNNNNTELWYPSDFPDSISVISTGNYANVFKQCKAPSSNYGKHKDISAPGHHVVVPTKSGSYKKDSSGTSFAAGVISAVAAMIYYVNPDTPADQSEDAQTQEIKDYGITAAQVEEIMKTTATDLYTAGDDPYTRCGNVNAYAAVAKAAGKTIPVEPSPLTAPSLKASSPGYNKVRLTWNQTSGAQGYSIYRADSLNGPYSCIKNLHGGKTTAFVDSGLRLNKNYLYKIKSFGTVDDKRSHSTDSIAVQGTPQLSGVTGFTASAHSYKSIRLTWKKTAGARGYQLFRASSKNGAYKTVKTITKGTKTSYIDSAGLTAGKTYYYQIRPYAELSGKRVYGKINSPVKNARAVPKRPYALKITKSTTSAKGSGEVKLKWSRISNITGYKISRSNFANRSFQVIETLPDKSASSFIDRNLKKNKTYYYKVRAYKQFKGKALHSSYSTVKKIKL